VLDDHHIARTALVVETSSHMGLVRVQEQVQGHCMVHTEQLVVHMGLVRHRVREQVQRKALSLDQTCQMD
jgi:hypothetical protein